MVGWDRCSAPRQPALSSAAGATSATRRRGQHRRSAGGQLRQPSASPPVAAVATLPTQARLLLPQPTRGPAAGLRTSCAASQLPWLAQAEMAALATSTVLHSYCSQARQKTSSASASRPPAPSPAMAAVEERWSSARPAAWRAASTRLMVTRSRLLLASFMTEIQGATSGCSSCRYSMVFSGRPRWKQAWMKARLRSGPSSGTGAPAAAAAASRSTASPPSSCPARSAASKPTRCRCMCRLPCPDCWCGGLRLWPGARGGAVPLALRSIAAHGTP